MGIPSLFIFAGDASFTSPYLCFVNIGWRMSLCLPWGQQAVIFTMSRYLKTQFHFVKIFENSICSLIFLFRVC